jgi:hypothetical protein
MYKKRAVKDIIESSPNSNIEMNAIKFPGQEAIPYVGVEGSADEDGITRDYKLINRYTLCSWHRVKAKEKRRKILI